MPPFTVTLTVNLLVEFEITNDTLVWLMTVTLTTTSVVLYTPLIMSVMFTKDDVLEILNPTVAFDGL